MKKIKNFFVVFDVLLLLVLAGLWAEKSIKDAVLLRPYKEQEHVPAMRTEQIPMREDTENSEQILEERNLIELEEKKIAITFDDGPHPSYTEVLLDGLKERGVVATFFVTGEHASLHPDIIKRMQKEGHLIGNHTYSHIKLEKGNPKAFKEELVKTNEILKEITGEDVVYVRPPYGVWDKNLEKDLKMFPVLWTIDPLDWCSSNVECIVDRIVENAKENDIILVHDYYESSVKAALLAVDELLEEGFTFVTVEEILFD